MVLSIRSQWELSEASPANFTARLRWERYRDYNENSMIFKILEMKSLRARKMGPYFVIHMLLRDTLGTSEGVLSSDINPAPKYLI